MEKEKTLYSLAENDTKNKIRTLYLQNESIAKILDILDIPKGTFDSYYYLNKYGVRDFMKELKKERFLLKTEKLSDEILDLKAYDNAKMLAIKQKEAEFVRETLLKDEGYTKRVETIGLNINKTEALDDEQKKKLDMLINKRQANSETI